MRGDIDRSEFKVHAPKEEIPGQKGNRIREELAAAGEMAQDYQH